MGYRRRENRIVVVDHEPMGSFIGERLAELLNYSAGGWVLGDVEVENPPPSVINRDPDVEQAKPNRWDDEEVHACDHFAVIAEKGDPALLPARIGQGLRHVTGYVCDPDRDAQFRQLGRARCREKRLRSWRALASESDSGRKCGCGRV